MAWLSPAASPKTTLSGESAFASYTNVQPGVWRHITAADLPKPFATEGVSNGAKVVARPEGAWPKAPEGFKVELFATGLPNPREIRRAPNGDLFVAETVGQGSITILRGKQVATFVEGLSAPFGMAFYPPGPNPRYLYIGNTASVVRVPYKNGDLQATGPVEVIIPKLPTGGHSTRDVVFSPDGNRMFVAVGSNSNVDDADTTPGEFHRANILEYKPDGTFVKVYGAGIRNPVGLAINPITGELWCSVNERDMLGDNLVPDYITHVQEGGFYGWPWFYMGSNQDPRLEGKHPEMKGHVIVPDILLQPHNASIRNDVLRRRHVSQPNTRATSSAAEHGSWNKAVRTGYGRSDPRPSR